MSITDEKYVSLMTYRKDGTPKIKGDVQAGPEEVSGTAEVVSGSEFERCKGHPFGVFA